MHGKIKILVLQIFVCMSIPVQKFLNLNKKANYDLARDINIRKKKLVWMELRTNEVDSVIQSIDTLSV